MRASEMTTVDTTTHSSPPSIDADMQVHVMEFKYDGTNGEDIETRLNEFLKHYDVTDVNVACSGDDMAVFLFYEP